jgi:hypothetical protein
MKNLLYLAGCLGVLLLVACSLPPGRPYTRQDIFRTNIYSYFTIKESPDSVLAVLNRDGEVVLEGEDKQKRVYYIKVISMDNELKTTFVEK